MTKHVPLRRNKIKSATEFITVCLKNMRGDDLKNVCLLFWSG